MMSRVIFVTGGVISGIGKGVISASIAALLKELGFSVSVIKFDPYLNIDPGVLNPYEHGEVFVTHDGIETDLDLGHYERFINQDLTGISNITSGRIFQKIMKQERDGSYGGKTVQMIPHFSNEVKEYIEKVISTLKADFLICEVGGTVGDIESEPFLFAIRDFIFSRVNNVFLVHIAYLPFLKSVKEFKTKPTQFSLKTLRSKVNQPNMLLLRCENRPPNWIIEKISSFSGLPKNRVLVLEDIETIYSSPLILEKLGFAQELLEYFNLPVRVGVWEGLKKFLVKLEDPDNVLVRIGMVAKYYGFPDAYRSILEALKISSAYTNTKIEIVWFDAEKFIDLEYATSCIKSVDSIVILPGFGYRGFEGKVNAAQLARDLKIPTLGICFGFQAMVISQARLCGIVDANSFEFHQEVPQQTSILKIVEGCDPALKGETLRLGSKSVHIRSDSKLANIYQSTIIHERFRHRFNVVNTFLESLQKDDFIFNSFDESGQFAQGCELQNHPFYFGVQFHPEFRAKTLVAHPLFSAFLNAVKALKIDKQI